MIGDRGKELAQQIAVRRVQFDGIDIETRRPFGGLNKGTQDTVHFDPAHRVRRRPAVGKGQVRRGCRRPPAGRRVKSRAAVPWQGGGSLASGVGELQGDLGFSVPAAKPNDAVEGLLLFVVVQPQTSRRDSALGLDAGRLHGHHSGARKRQAAQMHEMPVVGDPVLSRILAHGRDENAVGDFQSAQGNG